MELHVGMYIERTQACHPDTGDGHMNSLCGATFQITEMAEGFLMTTCCASNE